MNRSSQRFNRPVSLFWLRMSSRFVAVLLLIVMGIDVTEGQTPAKSRLRIEKAEEPAGWNIYDGDRLFAGYMLDSGGKPIMYPVNGPGGHPMTRNYPMKKNYGIESGDHDHQRSMWMSYGELNGVDFWKDDEGCGKIVHRSGEAEVADNGNVVLTTVNDWIAPSGKRVMSDTRRYEYAAGGLSRRTIDCDFLLKAIDGDVNFGDTKEGIFGMRVASSMRVDSKKGGIITNQDSKTNKQAWGKPSPWVNYSGPVNDEMVGLTIHNHPSSFGFPTRWHVRTYGLFAANPFARYDFVGGKRQDGIVLLKGRSIRLNYRVVIYQGEFDKDVAEADMRSYHNDPRPALD